MDRPSIRHQRQPTSRYMLNQETSGPWRISSIIQAGDGGAPAFYQAEIFEKLFGLYGISRTDIHNLSILRSFVRTCYLDHVEQHWVRGRGVWGGRGPRKIVTPQNCGHYDVLSKFGRAGYPGPYYNSSAGGSVPTFTKWKPRYRRTSTLGALKQARPIHEYERFWNSSDQARSLDGSAGGISGDRHIATAHLICAASNDGALCSNAIGWLYAEARWLVGISTVSDCGKTA